MSVTNLTDTYWRWNNDPTVWGFDSADLLFESNGVSCNYVSITESYDISDLPHTMEYFTADDSFYAWDSSHGWYDEAYREIHITGGDDVEDANFIELLENSATQFVPPVPYMTTSTELTSIADAIRAKGGTSAPLVYPTGFVSAINDISGGGGGTTTVSISDSVGAVENVYYIDSSGVYHMASLELDLETYIPVWTDTVQVGTMIGINLLMDAQVSSTNLTFMGGNQVARGVYLKFYKAIAP